MSEIAWSDSPPDVSEQRCFQVRRVKIDPMVGFITCEKPIGVFVHYWRGRTRPHVDDVNCEACLSGNSYRWKGYLSMYSPTSKEHWIQEFTSQAFEGLQKGIIAYGTLRGHEARFSRIRPNNTAPMRCEVWTKTIDLRTLPEAPDIKEIMFVVWDLKNEAVETNIDDQTALEALRHHKRNGNLTPSP